MKSVFKTIFCISTACIGFSFLGPLHSHESTTRHQHRPSIEGAKIKPNPIDRTYRKINTKRPWFLRDCGASDPGQVASITSNCPHITLGLLGGGSTVEILTTANRNPPLNGYRGKWYKVKVKINSAGYQNAATNAGQGAKGWVRGTAF